MRLDSLADLTTEQGGLHLDVHETKATALLAFDPQVLWFDRVHGHGDDAPAIEVARRQITHGRSKQKGPGDVPRPRLLHRVRTIYETGAFGSTEPVPGC
jgi:hypothetical protein